MKDPAFLFYASDFLGGVSDLTMEERGQYITLLCLQQQKGHLSRKVIGLCLGFDWDNASPDLRKKFIEDEDGLFFNPRLESELAKRQKFVEKQRNNGVRGGRPKNPNETQTKPTENPNDNPNTNPNKTLLENRNRNRIEDENIDEIEGGGTGEGEEQSDPEIDTTPEVSDNGFEDVWAMYGRKGNKKTSEKKWANLKNHCREAALQHIPRYVASTPDPQYRKNFETYINQEVWDDEIIERNPQNHFTGVAL